MRNDPGPTPGPTLGLGAVGGGMIRVVPDGPGSPDAPRWSHDHDTSASRAAHRAAHRAAPQPLVGATGAPSGSTATDPGPRVTRDEVTDLGRLRRSVTDRKVAGVAGGLARHLDVDPLLLRVGFVVLAFFGGAGLILYAACWALVPEEDRERAPVNLDERSRTIALVALGVIAALALVGDSWGGGWFPWPLAIIGLIVFVWLNRSRDRRPRRPRPTPLPTRTPCRTPVRTRVRTRDLSLLPARRTSLHHATPASAGPCCSGSRCC